MKKVIFILYSLLLFVISCQTKAENTHIKSENITDKNSLVRTNTPTKSNKKDINQKIGIVDGHLEDVCFRTKNGNLSEKVNVSIVTSLYDSPQKVLNAEIDKKLNKSCSRRASESTDQNPGENFYYSLSLKAKGIDENQEIFGVGVIEPGRPFDFKDGMANVDLNNDGKSEFFRRCAGFEGTLFAIWTGKPLKGEQIWHSFYYVDYQTEPNCKKKDGADKDY